MLSTLLSNYGKKKKDVHNSIAFTILALFIIKTNCFEHFDTSQLEHLLTENHNPSSFKILMLHLNWFVMEAIKYFEHVKQFLHEFMSKSFEKCETIGMGWFATT
jgi:coenzyme F420-reducing hydrogenase beta subunit